MPSEITVRFNQSSSYSANNRCGVKHGNPDIAVATFPAWSRCNGLNLDDKSATLGVLRQSAVNDQIIQKANLSLLSIS